MTKKTPKPRTEPEVRRAARKRSDNVIDWIETYCHIPEGRYIGHRVQLREWQKQEIRKIFDNPHGTRRAILSFGRKNAKTTLSAFLMLVFLVGPEAIRIRNGQLFSAAQSREQAAILFSLAAKVVRQSPALAAAVRIKDSTKQMFCDHYGTSYRALSAEASTAYGLSPALVIHDELGQVVGPRSELYDALETASGAQTNPMSIIISTQAERDGDLLSILIDDALAGHDPRTVVSLYTAPRTDPPFDERTIRKANPAFGDFLNAQEVMEMAKAARRMPAREAKFRNLVLNQRVVASTPFVTPASWMACGGEVKDLRDVPVYAGLDLSSVADLTAFVMIGEVDKVWQVKPTFWLPSEGIHDKSVADRVPYDLWAEKKFLELTPGATVSYEYVAKFLRQTFNTYNIQKLGFDRWNMKHLRPWLIKAGFGESEVDQKFQEFGQGTQSMSPALRDLEQAILDKRLVHGNHPVLAMCASCAVVEGKDDANRKLSKNKSTGRIDGMVALAMAAGVAPSMKVVDVASLIG